jgi:hypothetical protein
MRRPTSFIAVAFALVASIPVAKSFFDELSELKQELLTWETTHAADLSDLVNTLDDLSGTSFMDVSDSDWFSPYVISVSQWKIVSGYLDEVGQPTGLFGPANPVTVAELLKMASEAKQINEEECGLVPPLHAQAIGHWAAAYISCGEAGDWRILNDPNVDLNRPATRAEVVSLIDDAFGDQVPPLFSNFRDTVGHPLEADIAYAYSRGIVSGDKDAFGIQTGTFRPNDSINRAEVAKIVYERLKVDVANEVASQ